MKKRSVVLGVGLVAAAVALRLLAPGALEPKVGVDGLRALGPLSVPAYLLGYLLLTTLAVPAFVCHVVAGVAFGLPDAVAIAFLAANVASNLQFHLGRALGAARVSQWLARRGWLARLERGSTFGVFVIRVLPTPFVAVNVSAGASGMRWRHFAVGSGLGLLPHVVVHTFFAAQLYQGVEGARQAALGWAAGAAVVLIAGGAIGRWLVRRAGHGKKDVSGVL